MRGIVHPASCRRGLTLVEILMVIGIIASLACLLLPALQGARELARLFRCRNNLHQVGKALTLHEWSFKRFPAATEWSGGREPGFHAPWTRPNWVAKVLPHLDQQALYDSLDASQSIGAPANAEFRGTRLPVMRCPSDRFNDTPFNGSKYAMGNGWARGNYAVTGSQKNLNAADDSLWKKTFRGMMGLGRAVSADDVTDGLSNTIMVCEVRAGLEEIDPRGTWAMGDSASSIWGAGSFHWNEAGEGPWGAFPGADANGPNPANAFRMDSDNLVSAADLMAGSKLDMYFKQELMGFWPDYRSDHNNQSAVRSQHRSGVLVCLADGSVRWICDYIDTNGRIARNPPIFSVWDRLMASADGQAVSAEAF